MRDWFRPRPAILVTTARSGSTFLAHCLDSHPQIGCERGEPFSPTYLWRVGLKLDTETILSLMLDRPGYDVAMFRVMYRPWRRLGLAALAQERGASIVHNERENALRVAVSADINTRLLAGDKRLKGHRVHTYEPLPPVHVTVKVSHILNEMLRYRANVAQMKEELAALGLPFLCITYAQIVGGEGNEATALPEDTGRELCEFLGVEYSPMASSLRRVNPRPLCEFVENWDELRRAVKAAGFGRYLEEEGA